MIWPWHRAPRPGDELLTWEGRVARDHALILDSLSRIERKVDRYMQDLNTELGDIKRNKDATLDSLGAIATRLQKQSDQIAALTEQLNGQARLTPEQQAELDAINAEAAALASALVPPAEPVTGTIE